jgi:ATP-dependent Clp protease ATP-binding subunit ClpA
MILSEPASVVRLTLWSILRWERKLGLVAIQTMCDDVDTLERQIDSLLCGDVASKPIAGTKEKKVVAPTGLIDPLIAASEEASHALQHNWVGTEHLLLAVIQLADSELSNVLKQHGIGCQKASEVIQDLQNP